MPSVLGEISVGNLENQQQVSPEKGKLRADAPTSPSYSSSAGSLKDNYRKRLLREYSRIPDHASIANVEIGTQQQAN